MVLLLVGKGEVEIKSFGGCLRREESRREGRHDSQLALPPPRFTLSPFNVYIAV
jgi:hypothetical protein